MADRYLLESGSPDGYLLEDASGVLLLEVVPVSAGITIHSGAVTHNGYGSAVATGTYSFGSGFRFVVIYYSDSGTRSISSVAGSVTGAWSLISGPTADGWAIYACPTTQSAGSETITVTLNIVNDFTVLFGGTGANIGDISTVADTAARPASSLADPKTFDDSLDVPGAGIGLAGVKVGGSTTVTANNGTLLLNLDDSALSGYAFAIIKYATAATPSYSSGSQNTTSGIGAAWAVVASGVALTGQSVTASLGTLTPSVSYALTGQSLSAAQGQVLQGAPLVGQSLTAARGSPTASVTIALVGQSLSAAAGTVTAASAFALAGQPVSIAQGSVAATLSPALAGQAVTVSRGSLLATTSLPLSGQALTLAQGTVTAGTSDVTVALTGHSITASQGSLGLSISPALAGQEAVSQLGTIAPAFNATLAGQSLIADQGDTGAGLATELLGSNVTVLQGSVVAASNDVTVALTGVAAVLAQGSLSAEAISTYLFWRQPPLIGRRISVSRSR